MCGSGTVSLAKLHAADRYCFEIILAAIQISSPNYPGNYGNNVDVSYYLMASAPGSVVVLTFASIQTEDGPDTIIVFDGANFHTRVLHT